jgi:DMSO/TMAO reductase YedYZ heme-binding membrane subunit
MKRPSLFNPIVTACAIAMGAVIVGCLAYAGAGEAGLRLLLRMSARISFVLFVVTFLASPLHTLAPGPITEQLRANRRSLGLAFALAHFTAGLCVITYVSLYPDSFYAVTYPLQRIGGTVGFLAIATMVITSFDVTKRWMTVRQWKILHSVCLYFISINYLVSFGRRVVLHRDPFYAPFLVMLLVAVAVRLYAARAPARRSQVA